MNRQRRDTPAMIVGNRDATQAPQEVVAGQHERQHCDCRCQPEILRSPPEDQREGGVGTNKALGVEPEGEIEQFRGKENNRPDDGGEERHYAAPARR